MGTAPALTNRASLALAAKPINVAAPRLGTSVCYPPKKHHHALVMPAQSDQGEMPPQVQATKLQIGANRFVQNRFYFIGTKCVKR